MIPGRARIKAALPGGLARLASRARSYLRRLGVWGRVLREVRGDRPGDALRLYASALAAPVTALADLDHWGHPRLLWGARLRVPGLGRFDCRAGGDDLWHVLPSAQGAVRGALLARLRPGDALVDAGANIGVFSVLAARLVGPSGRIVAIEMMPDTARRLRETLALNGISGVKVVEAALADVADQTLWAQAPEGLSGQASLVAQAFRVAQVARVAVRTTTLDLACADLGPVALIKLDLEGAEALALAGAAGVLARTRALVYEQRPGEGQGVEALLAAAGFTTQPLGGTDRLALRGA